MENTTALVKTFGYPGNVEEWNSEYVRAVLPDTVILVVYLIVGVVGNSLVICVYSVRFKTESDHDRFYIPYLAVIDLCASIVCPTFEIYINLHIVDFTDISTCKIFWVLAVYTTSLSVYTLLLIAIERYKKICRPFQPQMSLRTKKLTVVCCVVGCAIIALPSYLFHGGTPAKHPRRSIVGSRCINTIGPLPGFVAVINKGVMLLIGLTSVTALGVLYSLIGKRISQRIRKNNKRHKSLVVLVSTANTTPLQSTTALASGATSADTNTARASTSDAISSDTTTSPVDPTAKQNRISTAGVTNLTKKQKQNKMSGYRITMMFMLITSVFLLCYIPKVAMMVFESRNEKMWWLTMDYSTYAGYRFFNTMYILNSIVNPMIYGLFDKKFRQECVSLCRGR